MVDLVNAGGWLLDASLFGDEPIDSTNFGVFFSGEKANSKGDQAVLNSPSAGWYDEKVDLSAFDNPDGLLDHRNETNMWMEDHSAYLLGLLGDSFDPSEFVAPDLFKNEEINLIEEIDFSNLIPEPTSTEILDTHLASPTCNTLQVNSPEFFSAQSPASPYSDISDAEESSCSFAVQSPESSSITSDYTTNSLDSPQKQVLANDNVASSSSFESEVSQSLKRKAENDGGTKQKIYKVMFPEDICRSSTRRTKSCSNRQERKKVQNKEAAARYRVKKRIEEKVLSDEVEDLETIQKKLQDKHDDLQSEIKYLKSLMCEILVKKGIMK